ncbi:MAG: hypothetical protein C0602_08450 [Denitrovibrio sp.]|nr:MAG: hypothetical protein C0602_08450 [Denitrovibrio sp.]
MKWPKEDLTLEDGERIEAQTPIIVSASRSTDIPAFYSDWFMSRLKAGYSQWINPFNGVKSYISYSKTRVIVFWSKNPRPIIKHLNYLDDSNINYYFQFTLNDYVNEELEKKVGYLDKRINTFIELSEKVGKEKVIWRFDPYILTATTGVQELLRRTEYIGNSLSQYTEKFVFSFADISTYRKVKANIDRFGVKYKEFDTDSMNELAKGIADLNNKWNFDIGTCAEGIDLASYNITHNKCIDDDLMIKLFGHDNELMDFLGYKSKDYYIRNIDEILNEVDNSNKYKLKKDKGQRENCGCVISKDIGQYNTCPHECIYCYANTSIERAKNNYDNYKKNQNKPTLTGY